MPDSKGRGYIYYYDALENVDPDGTQPVSVPFFRACIDYLDKKYGELSFDLTPGLARAVAISTFETKIRRVEASQAGSGSLPSKHFLHY